MKKIEHFLNIIHYCIYRLDYRLHMLSNKLNPFLLLGKIPAVGRKFEEQGTTHLDVVNKIWTDKRYGFSVMISGGGLVIIIFFTVFSFYLTISYILNNPLNISWRGPFVFCMALAYIICHYTVFQKDKYIRYFRQFDKWSKQEKWQYGLSSFAFIVGSIILWVYSFRFLPG